MGRWLMTRAHPQRRLILLVIVLAAVAVITYHPHWNPLTGERHAYPVHMDEYVHWGYAQAVVDDGDLTFRDPFTGGDPGTFSVSSNLHEYGYWAYLGAFQGTTGIPWLTLFQYGPMIVAAFLALSVYVVAERWGAGLEAAVLVACIPTTLRFLGPGFMVPIVFSLPFVATGLFTLVHARSAGGFVAFLIIAAAVWPIHIAGAAALLVLSLLYALFLTPLRPRHALLCAALALVPFFAIWDFYQAWITRQAEWSPFLPANEGAVLHLGVLPLLATVLGAGVLMARRRASDHAAGAALGSGVLVTELIILWRLSQGEDVYGVYDRMLMILALLASILGGVGLAALAEWARRATRRHPLRRRHAVSRTSTPGIAIALAILLTSTVAASAIPQFQQPYYALLTDDRYEAYTTAAHALNESHELAVVDGLPTMPFSILTGVPTLHVHFPSSGLQDPPEVRRFFEDGAADTTFLVANKVTVVATERPVENPDLTAVADGVYVLRWDYVARMTPDRSS